MAGLGDDEGGYNQSSLARWVWLVVSFMLVTNWSCNRNRKEGSVMQTEWLSG